MGLENTTGKITYLNLKEGKFAKKNSNGDIQLFDAVSGIITKVDFKDDEYSGKKFRKLLITIVDGDDSFLVQIRTDSGYYRSLTNAIANGDIKLRTRLMPMSKDVNGKPQTTIFVTQGGKPLKFKWTKDNPGKLPPLRKVKVNGNEVYDNTDQSEFFESFWKSLPLAAAAPVVNEIDEEPPF